jgi:hypothetical protein
MFLHDLSVACVVLAGLIRPIWSAPLIAERWEHEKCNYTHHPPGPHPHRPPPFTPHFEKRNFDTIQGIYNLTIYPNQVPILLQGAAGVPAGLFNANATGRVDPVGNFTGFDDSIEYFFALAPVPLLYPAAPAITSIKITEFSSACPSVAASVVYLFLNVSDASSPNNGKSLAPLKQVSAVSGTPGTADV